MNHTFLNFSEIKNMQQPFTELFSLIKLYDILPNSIPSFSYRLDELNALYTHADNAINIVLQVLQDIGSLISFAEQAKKPEVPNDLNGIGYLITSISNLAEALYFLKTHINFALQHCRINES